MIPRFCIQNRITDREATPCTVAQLLEVMASEHVQTICDQIKLLDQEYPNGGTERDEELARLKKQLPIITPHAQKFINNERKNQNAIPSGLVMLDIDHVESPSMATLDLDESSCRANQIYYVGITPSGHGLRIIAERLEGETLAQGQSRLGDLLHVQLFDGATKDLARASFLVPRSYILYLDASGLEFQTEEEAQKVGTFFSPSEASGSRGQQLCCSGQELEIECRSDRGTRGEAGYRETVGDGRGHRGTAIEERPLEASDEPRTMASYQGLPYKDIISHLVLLLGGEPQFGERNTFYFTLVRYARYICDFRPDVLLAVLPDFGLSETERRGVITSAINRPRKSTIPDIMQRAITAAQVETESSVESPLPAGEGTEERPLPLPKLPKVLSLICKRLPEEFRPAMVIAALPILGTLATKVRFTYLDHQEHSFSFMSCITAPAATGKSFIRRPINLLLTPIDEQDEIEREKEQEYKDKLRAAKNSKVQPENPRACPRNNGINISIAKLLQLLSYSEGKHLIGIGEEIDTLVKSERAGVWSQKSDIYRLGFDNAKYGQNYMSDNSFSANVPVYYNLLLTGTPGGMYRFFRDVEDGLVTRFAFAQLPDMFGTDIPDFQPYTKGEENEIIRIARTLDMASGTIYCSAVDEAIGEWLRAKKQQAIAADSRAIDTIRKRAAVMGFRAGYLAALLNGSATKGPKSLKKIEPRRNSSAPAVGTVGIGATREAAVSEGLLSPSTPAASAAAFALWVAEYIFQNQMQLFGSKFEQVANDWENQNTRRGSVRGLLAQLPTTFTKSELMALRIRNNQSSNVNYVLTRWITAGFISETDRNVFTKTNHP